jgi:hypothetical protein
MQKKKAVNYIVILACMASVNCGSNYMCKKISNGSAMVPADSVASVRLLENEVQFNVAKTERLRCLFSNFQRQKGPQIRGRIASGSTYVISIPMGVIPPGGAQEFSFFVSSGRPILGEFDNSSKRDGFAKEFHSAIVSRQGNVLDKQ